VRGNHFGNSLSVSKALPASINDLSSLREFIGFQQGSFTFHGRGAQSACQKMTCLPTYETLITIPQSSDAESEWKCKPLVADLEDLPIFHLRFLEKFWSLATTAGSSLSHQMYCDRWDMNALTATPKFFHRVVASWPRLKTLDLYDNRYAHPKSHPLVVA
jgi:hypothetical protein